MSAVVCPGDWLKSSVSRLDSAREDQEIVAAVKATRTLLDAVGLGFADLVAALVERDGAPHLTASAPVTLQTVRALLDCEYERLPLSYLPALGDLAKRLRNGGEPNVVDVATVNRARSAVRGAR